MYVSEECPCKRIKCQRYKDCDACKEYHRQSRRKPLTACERTTQPQEKQRQRHRKTES